MKNLSFLKHNLLQRITYDDVLTRFGSIEENNLKQVIGSVVGRVNACLKGGHFGLVSGLTFSIEEDSFWVQKKTLTEVDLIAQPNFIQITLDAESSGNDRIDLIEARAVEVDRRPITVDTINQLTAIVSQVNYNTDRRIVIETRVRKGTPAASPVALESNELTLATFINNGVQGNYAIDLSSTIDLSSLYNLKISIDGSEFKTIDCRGGTPAATTRQEIINKINLDATFAAFAISKTSQTFTSSGTTVTINTTTHGLSKGHSIVISSSTNTGDLPNGVYVVTSVIDADNFTIETLDAGDDVGGNCSWDFKVAAFSGDNYITIQSPTNTENSKIRIIPPASLDATRIILGLVEDTDYFYKYESIYEWFKIGEVLVQNGAASLIAGNLRDIYNKDLWTTTNSNDAIFIGTTMTDNDITIPGEIICQSNDDKIKLYSLIF